MNIYALTPTGCRPEGMALLAEYLNAQTYRGPLKWIIVDDCKPETRIPRLREGIDVTVIYPGWTWKAGMNTQAACMSAGLDKVPDDAVLFILEDDDIYLPDYMKTALKHIRLYELIGEINSRYYNVVTEHWQILKGRFHSSMAATVCRGDALKLLRDICEGPMRKMLDVNLWKQFNGAKKLIHSGNVVGIKGLPGRPGIGVGHRANFGRMDTDNTLKNWVGDYAENYNLFRVHK